MKRERPTEITQAMSDAGILEFLFWDDAQGAMLCRVDPKKIKLDKSTGDIVSLAYPACSLDGDVLTALGGANKVNDVIKRGDQSMIVLIGFAG